MVQLLRYVAAAAGLQTALGMRLNINSKKSIHNALDPIARNIMSYFANADDAASYQIGLLPAPKYYWWEAGAVWGAMVDHWALTGSKKYVKQTQAALAAQVGPAKDYVMAEQAWNEANDDQQFWIFAVMSAMEQGFPKIADDYLSLAKNAFNDMVSRWQIDSAYCNGGLRWQYLDTMNGWNYKNSISNAGFFNMAARLAKFTGEEHYAKWAEKIFDWMRDIGFITPHYMIFDGATTDSGCKNLNTLQFSYTNAVMMHGMAVMFHITKGKEQKKWHNHLRGLLKATEGRYFSPYKNATDIMYEHSCETEGKCDLDQKSFKGILAGFMGKTAQLAPFSRQRIHRLLHASAKAAAHSCHSASHGVNCGSRWYIHGGGRDHGLGQALSAFETIQALLATVDAMPKTRKQFRKEKGHSGH